jgi:hypothetical protein
MPREQGPIIRHTPVARRTRRRRTARTRAMFPGPGRKPRPSPLAGPKARRRQRSRIRGRAQKARIEAALAHYAATHQEDDDGGFLGINPPSIPSPGDIAHFVTEPRIPVKPADILRTLPGGQLPSRALDLAELAGLAPDKATKPVAKLSLLDIAPAGVGKGVGIATKLARAGRAVKAASAAGRTAEAAKTVKAARAAERGAHDAPWLRAHLDRVRLTPAERTAVTRGSAQAAKAATKRAPWKAPVRAAKAVRANRAVRAVTAPARFGYRHKGKAFGAAVGAPLAVSGAQSAQQGSLDPFTNALETGGTVGRGLSEAGQSLSKLAPSGVARNIVRDAFDLPAQALPAVYLPAAGIVEAAQGDSSRLRELWHEYERVGVIPAIVEGKDPLKAIERHPLFSALELSGTRAVAGRGLGAAGRAARIKAAGTKRAPLDLGGDLAPVERRYSPDIFERAVQVARDRRRAKHRGGQVASPHERARYLRERVDRVVGETEQIRRQHRAEEAEAAKVARPKRREDADAVALAVQGIVRSPRSFHGDLASFARQLDEAYASGDLSRSQRIANRELAATVKRARKSGNPEAVFESARAYVKAHGLTEQGLIERGLLSPEQAEKAAAFPFAVQHMGAKHGRPKGGGPRQLLDRHGNPLPLEKVRAEMRRQGVEPGFVTQRPGARGRGSFYRAFFGTRGERQSLSKARRTGKATREGTFDASYEALAEQRIRSRAVVDATKAFDRAVNEFAVGRRRFKSFREAQDVARDPQDFGLDVPRDLELVPVRLAPLRAAREEVATAERTFDAMDPDTRQSVSVGVSKLLDEAQAKGPGPVVLVPHLVVDRLRQHFQPAGVGRRAMQALSSVFKGTVLPLSPQWLAGNVLDVSLRSLLAGLGAGDYVAGRRLLKALDRVDAEAGQRMRAQLGAGHYGSAAATRVHRDAAQFVGSALAPLAERLAVLGRTPGIKHLVNAYAAYRDGVFELNSRFVEHQPRYAALGKEARRELQAETGRWHHGLQLGGPALEDLARGTRHREASALREGRRGGIRPVDRQQPVDASRSRGLRTLRNVDPGGLEVRSADPPRPPPDQDGADRRGL